MFIHTNSTIEKKAQVETERKCINIVEGGKTQGPPDSKYYLIVYSTNVRHEKLVSI